MSCIDDTFEAHRTMLRLFTARCILYFLRTFYTPLWSCPSRDLVSVTVVVMQNAGVLWELFGWGLHKWDLVDMGPLDNPCICNSVAYDLMADHVQLAIILHRPFTRLNIITTVKLFPSPSHL